MTAKPKDPEVSAKPKCPVCTSSQVYLRLVKDEFVCRSCGHTWEREKEVSRGTVT